MNKEIRFSCTDGGDPAPMREACGDVSVSAEKMTVVAHRSNNFGHYICRCPGCGVVQHRKISPAKVALLVDSGAELEVTPEARPSFMEPLSNEPPISQFEVNRNIELMNELGDTELYTHLVEGVE
jgi:hypothetical protein